MTHIAKAGLRWNFDIDLNITQKEATMAVNSFVKTNIWKTPTKRRF